MEIIGIVIIVLLAGIIFYLLKKNDRLKRDIYDFTEKLDYSLNELLNGKTLNTAVYKQDDLWGMVYDRLCRVSGLYACKNQEIYEEKESLKELVSDISHQTKTPLANIKLYQEMLLNESDPGERAEYPEERAKYSEERAEYSEERAEYPEKRTEYSEERAEYLKKMGGQVDKLDFLIQSMVKMSRLETGTIKIQKSESLISETLSAALEAAIPKADQKNMRISVAYDEKLRLNHDKKWTAEAVFNILDNAVKYTETGGKIHISVNRGEIFTKISVADTGKGILTERQGTIFTRFYREPEVHDNEGVGIGLYLARKIISMQDGYIEVESEVGKGSTFHICLPN